MGKEYDCRKEFHRRPRTEFVTQGNKVDTDSLESRLVYGAMVVGNQKCGDGSGSGLCKGICRNGTKTTGDKMKSGVRVVFLWLRMQAERKQRCGFLIKMGHAWNVM